MHKLRGGASSGLRAHLMCNRCENLLGLFKVLAERIESLQGQEAARCHESSSGVFVLSEQAKAAGLVEMLGAA